jgi:phenylacetate-CoA ligase
VVRREGGQEVLEILVEVSEQIFFDEMRKQRKMVDDIRQRVLEELDLPARVRLVESRSLQGTDGETPKVIDERPR